MAISIRVTGLLNVAQLRFKEMNRKRQILETEEFVRQNLKDYDSGHDWWHIVRVRKLATFINEMEQIEDPFIVDITALLHDTADSKFARENKEQGYQIIEDFMEKCGMSDIKDRVKGVIRMVSFSNKNHPGDTDDPLLWVIQDADRLDAIGAIGIARAFNYGGFRNNKIYNPAVIDSGNNPGRFQENGTSSTISHFYEKLLLLKYRMNTMTAKKLAIERHEFLELFLKQFYKEWEFGTGERL
jgi:uncharacterized protein